MRDFCMRYGTAVYTALAFHGRRFWGRWAVFFFVLALTLFGGYFLLAPPWDFVPGTIVVIKNGSSTTAAAEDLTAAHIITQSFAFRAIIRLFGKGNGIQEGAYRFSSPENMVTVANRLERGTYGLPTQRITFTEGMTVRTMAAKIAAVFPEITATDFLAAAQPYEGYLFPDTYFFQPSATAESIVTVLRENFKVKTAVLASEAAASGHSFSDVVIMASLIQKEARTSTDQHMVAGILWNRIARNMPLQVDAVFGYIFGRSTYSPSFTDLNVDSPYNTYTHRGLPPGPIDNPGLVALDAAEHPTRTNYLYYLTGSDGLMHYALTYAAQLANQHTYLR